MEHTALNEKIKSSIVKNFFVSREEAITFLQQEYPYCLFSLPIDHTDIKGTVVDCSYEGKVTRFTISSTF